VFACIVLAAFIYNWRYFKGYLEILGANRALAAGDINRGAALFEAASVRLPEIKELSVLHGLYKAQKLLGEDKNEEALAVVRKTKATAPPQMANMFQQVELMSEIGVSFDQHDYDMFLTKSEELANLVPNEPRAIGGVASAYACKFAQTGDPKFRTKALEQLERAKSIPSNDDDFAEFENRIQFRLQTREIIDRDEFQKRFPNGWHPEQR
jgi:hypothetical protein